MKASPHDRVGRIFGGAQAAGLGLAVLATVVLALVADKTQTVYAFWGLGAAQATISIIAYLSLRKQDMQWNADHRRFGDLGLQSGFPARGHLSVHPPERLRHAKSTEFQTLMYRPLYWQGCDGEVKTDFDLSLGTEPEWDEDGRTVTVRIKPWSWSNGETVCADNVMFWVNMLAEEGSEVRRLRRRLPAR